MMVVEWSNAQCTNPGCDWKETDEAADLDAEQHAEKTGHRVELEIHAHIGNGVGQ